MEYARDLGEVKLVGQDTSPVRTADQTHLAHFWFEPSPMGWSRVASVVSTRQAYDLHETARLFALLNMAMADGFIVGWRQKTHFGLWRPITAIRAAAELENAESRVVVGIHFRFACEAGANVGRHVGEFAITYSLVPLISE